MLLVAVIVLFGLHFSSNKPSQEKVCVASDSTMVVSGDFGIAYVSLDSLLLNYEYAKKLSEEMINKEETSRADLNQKAKVFQQDVTEFQRKLQNNGFLSRDRAENEQERLAKAERALQELNHRITSYNVCYTKLLRNSSPVAVGSWSVISGTGVFTPDNSPHAVVTNIAPGENVYAWTLTYADNVTTTDEVRIINNSVSKAFAGIDREVCSDSYVLEAGTPEYGTSTWEIISGGGEFDNINLPGTTVRNLAKGENILSIKIEQGTCYTTDEVTIINNLPSTADAGLEEVSICKDSIELYPSTASRITSYNVCYTKLLRSKFNRINSR